MQRLAPIPTDTHPLEQTRVHTHHTLYTPIQTHTYRELLPTGFTHISRPTHALGTETGGYTQSKRLAEIYDRHRREVTVIHSRTRTGAQTNTRHTWTETDDIVSRAQKTEKPVSP